MDLKLLKLFAGFFLLVFKHFTFVTFRMLGFSRWRITAKHFMDLSSESEVLRLSCGGSETDIGLIFFRLLLLCQCEIFRQCINTTNEMCDIDNVHGVSCTSSGVLSSSDFILIFLGP